MNRIVTAWQRSQAKSKYEGPDTFVFGDEKFQIQDEEEMAQRKKPDLGPHINSDEKKVSETLVDIDRIQKELLPDDFNSVIRTIKRTRMDEVIYLRNATEASLKRLKVRRDKRQSVKGLPDASDHHDFGSIVTWMSKLQNKKTYKKAIKQLVAIDATANARILA